MREFFANQLGQIVLGVFTAVLLFIPTVFVFIKVWRMKRRIRAERAEPFNELPLRPAGESLRLKIEEIGDEQSGLLFGMMLAPILGFTVLQALLHGAYKAYSFPIALLIASLGAFLSARKLIPLTRTLWQYRLGFDGERAVGEELTQLLAEGYRVFHDLPFENFNIDHVIVGPSGVYAVETKTRRKPKEDGKKAGHRVEFDGNFLTFEKLGRDTRAVAQAKANAQALSQWLSGETGERIAVRGIVTIPGWWVDDSTQHPVWVLNPKRIRVFITRPAESALPQKRVNQLVYKLTERCRLKKV